MTELKTLLKADKSQPATALHVIDKTGVDAWLRDQPEGVRRAAEAQGFKGEGFQIAILPGERADQWSAVLGVADAAKLSVWCLAKAAESLPQGTYRLSARGPGPAVLGWLLGQYEFSRYRKDPARKGARVLLTDEPARIDETLLIAEANFLVRDLVNTPAGDMGPAELEAAAAKLAEQCGANCTVTRGTDLEQAFPMIAAVGGAASAERSPRLIELVWGGADKPKMAIIGKGVCFDSGGLDIKPSSAMRLMKKDMGGGAQALALGLLIMKSRLPVRLHLLIPAVENAVSASAMRPGDVLRSRKGLSVEIGNTDAEGRLVLADALTRAVECEPQLILDFATLTGAARTALGPDLPALFTNRDALADDLVRAGDEVADPLWRLPLWASYDEMLASDIADTSNASDSAMAGAITAALFLQKFVPGEIAWAHVDTFAWRPAAKPGRPKGGDALGLRAAWQVIRRRFAQNSDSAPIFR